MQKIPEQMLIKRQRRKKTQVAVPARKPVIAACVSVRTNAHLSYVPMREQDASLLPQQYRAARRHRLES
jgi:hypothetical protein